MSRAALLILLTIAAPAIAQPPARVDLAGDPLPAGAIARLGTLRFRSRGWHQQVFFSADGQTVISNDEGGGVRVWEVATGKMIGQVGERQIYNGSADLSPDGKLMAMYGHVQGKDRKLSAELRVHDVAEGKPLWAVRPVDLDRGEEFVVRFTPDVRRLITADSEGLRVWDVKTGDELFRQRLRGRPMALDLSPDGKTVAIGSYEAHLWDWESGAEPRKINTGVGSRAELLKFAPDGKTVFVGESSRPPRGFDVASGKLTRRLETDLGPRWVSFSPGGERYAVGHHNLRDMPSPFVEIRETASGRELMRLRCGENASAGAWSRDGSRFAAVTDNRIWVWDMKSGKPLGPDVPGHEGAISDFAFAPDGRLFTASDDHTVRAWDPATGRQLMRLDLTGWMRGVALSPDGSRLAAIGLRNELRVWDAATGAEQFKLVGHGEMGGLRRVRFAADGKTMVSFGDDWYLRTWDTRTGKLRTEHQYRPELPNRPGLDEDDDNRWEMEMMMGSRAVDLGPDGNTFVIGAGKEVTVYDADSGKERRKFEADPQHVNGLALSRDGRRLATAGSGVAPPTLKPGQQPPRQTDFQAAIWDLESAKPIVKFRVPGESFGVSLVFAPDGNTLATLNHGSTLQLWDAKTGAAVGAVELPGRSDRVAFDPSGKRLVAAFWDTTAVVFDLAAILKPAKTGGGP